MHRAPRTWLATLSAAPLVLGATLLAPPTPARASGYWETTPISSSEIIAEHPDGKPEAASCTEQLFVGVRGSGEPAPFGHTIERVRDHLAAVVPKQTRVVYIDYPAVSPHSLTTDDLGSLVLDQRPAETAYTRSVTTGRAALDTLLDWSATSCPNQKVVLAGFSQGAEVITTAMGGRAQAPVAATILLGNPAHFPGQNVRELDQQVDTPAIGLVATLEFLRARALPTATTDHRTGVHNLVEHLFRLHEGEVSTAEFSTTLMERREVLPAAAYATTFSVCQPDDMVCDAAPALSRVMTSTSTLPEEFSRSRPVHNGYTPQVASNTLTEVARILNGSPASDSRAPGAAQDSVPSGTRTAWLPFALGAGLVLVLGAAVAAGVVIGRRGRR